MFYSNFRSNVFNLMLPLLLISWVRTPAQLLQQESSFLKTECSSTVVHEARNGFIQVPVRMGGAGLNAVTGFHLFLSFNHQKLQFAGISPGAVTNVAVIPTNGLLSLQYSNIQVPINCTQPVIMFYLNFTRLAQGDVSLNFMHGSQVAGLSSLLPVNFQNGMVLQTWQLSLESLPVGAGLLSGSGEYLPGQSASISAIANQGYHFINWMRNGQIVSTQPDFDFTMPAENVSLTANFGLNSYMVQLQANPSAGGSVSGSGAYFFGQSVQVQATPNTGWAFTGWMLDGQMVSTDPNYSFTMPASNLLLWANFEQIPYPLQLVVNPSSAGTVTGEGNFFYNTAVTVQATPDTGWSFTGWTLNGQLVSSSAIYNFNMPAAGLILQANFEQILYPLQLVVNPAGAGTVSGTGNYTFNAQVTVQAQPEPAYDFMSWNQGSTVLSTNPTYAFSMPPNALLLTARFSLKTYLIEVVSSNLEFGTVTGGGVFTHGQSVTVLAQPAQGYQFIAWTEQGQTVSQQAVYNFTANANRSLVAVFQQVLVCPQPLSLTITAIGEQFVNLSWVSPEGIEQWDLRWGLAGFDPATEGTLIQSLTQTSYMLEGLNPQTTYDVYVRAWCENTYVSEWTGPLQFMTWYVGQDEIDDLPKVFPNPASTNLNVLMPSSSGRLSIEIYSADGRLVLQKSELSHEIRLNINHLPEGSYHLHLRTNKGVTYSRLMIIRR